jgi:hypothetical protein
MANIIMYMFNIARVLYGPKGTPLAKLMDFMPEWDKPPEDPVTKMKEQLLSLAEEQNEKVRRDREHERQKNVKKAQYELRKPDSPTRSRHYRSSSGGKLAK